MKSPTGILFAQLLIIFIISSPIILLLIWGHKRYLNEKEKKKQTHICSTAYKYYLNIPSELNEWAETQGALQDSYTGEYYVVSQHIKDHILKKLEYPFYKKAPILTQHEVENYKRLYQAATPLNLEVFTKVRMLDLLDPIVDESSQLFKYFKKIIWAKHVDFVIWSPHTESVICIVELDDFSHEREDRKARDEFVETMLKKAGYIYLHYPTIYENKMYCKLLNLTQSTQVTMNNLQTSEMD